MINFKKQGKSNKVKGRRYEQETVKFLKQFDNTCGRTPNSGAIFGWEGDILCRQHPLLAQAYIECKYRKNQSLPAWIQESKDRIQQQNYLIVFYAKPYQPTKIYFENLLDQKSQSFSSLKDFGKWLEKI